MSDQKNAPDYGVDAPGVIRGFFAASATLFTLGLVSLAFGAAMTSYGRRGKFVTRDRMLSLVEWSGEESVLDIGTGRGLLAVGAAKRLTTGKVVGIDIWNDADLSGNTQESAQDNARQEGVGGKIEVRTEDARAMQFADSTFDVVLSLLCLHNIENKREQEAACREIARVLKPGGRAIIGDYIGTADYARYFAQAGLTVSSRESFVREARSLMYIVSATKPEA